MDDLDCRVVLGSSWKRGRSGTVARLSLRRAWDGVRRSHTWFALIWATGDLAAMTYAPSIALELFCRRGTAQIRETLGLPVGHCAAAGHVLLELW